MIDYVVGAQTFVFKFLPRLSVPTHPTLVPFLAPDPHSCVGPKPTAHLTRLAGGLVDRNLHCRPIRSKDRPVGTAPDRDRRGWCRCSTHWLHVAVGRGQGPTGVSGGREYGLTLRQTHIFQAGHGMTAKGDARRVVRGQKHTLQGTRTPRYLSRVSVLGPGCSARLIMPFFGRKEGASKRNWGDGSW